MKPYLTPEVRTELYTLKKTQIATLERMQGEKDVAEMKAYTLAIVLGCVVGFLALFTFYPT